jgi:hypothetical protein
MHQGIARRRLPEEDEIDAKLIEADRLEAELALLQEATETLKLRLAQFEAEYTAAVAPLYLQYDRWKIRRDELRWSIERLRRLQADSDSTPADFSTMRRERDDHFRAHWEELRNSAQEDGSRRAPASYAVLDQGEQTELQQLYRSLAKRFHPDLASTPGVKAAREKKMRAINAAYQSKNLESLRQMINDPDLLDEFQETLADRLVRLVREVARLRRLVTDAQAALEHLRGSDLAELLADFDEAEATGSDSMVILTAAIRRKIDVVKEEWDHLRAHETQLWKAID